ncbi:MAG TPA: PQQ-binding-like beta-propeller repeat protein [Fimbriimonadaceae bacterium]|nr:PQQ-binding-like beta-propeller repeat protein [Fimbriimonadaceae bacterium]
MAVKFPRKRFTGGFSLKIRTRVMSVLGGLALAAVGLAQVSGPTPLAWRWAQPTSVAPSGVPTVVGNSVVVAVGSRIYSLDKETGNQNWKYPAAEAIDGSFRTGVLHHGNVVVAAADNQYIYAVDAATGESKWQYNSDRPINGRPVMCGKLLVFAVGDDQLMAVDSENGQPAWTAPYKVFDRMQGSLTAVNANVVFFTQKNELVSLNTLNQKSDWRRKFTTVNADVAPVLFGDTLYMNAGTFLSAVSASNGVPRLERNLGEVLMFSPMVSSSGIAVATRDGNLMFLDSNGRPQSWRDAAGKSVPAKVNLGTAAIAPPSQSGKAVIVPTSNGAMNMYDMTNGKVLWSFTLRPHTAGLKFKVRTANGEEERPVIAVPAAGPALSLGDSVMILSQDGSLLCFNNSFGVDVTAPEVKMAWPMPGSQVNGRQLDVVFQVEDQSTGVNDATIAVTANGQPCIYEFGRDGVLVVRFNNFVKNPQLRDGRVAFKVTVSDWLGNQRTMEYGLFIDNALKPLGTPQSTLGAGGGTQGGGGGPSRGGGGLGGGGGGG